MAQKVACPYPDPDPLLQVDLRSVAIRPHLIGGAAGLQRRTSGVFRARRNIRLLLAGRLALAGAASVGAEDRTEGSKLVPSDNELLHVRRVILFVREVAANVSGPVAEREQTNVSAKREDNT